MTIPARRVDWRLLCAQPCNTIGVARGNHKQCGCQVAVVNLDPSERFKTDNILLPVMTTSSVYKAKGMSRVLAGVDLDGTVHDEPSYASDVAELDAGVWIELPDDEGGGTRWWRLRGGQIVVSADYLAQQSLIPKAESTRAHKFCRLGCDYDSSHPAATRPFSFLRKPRPESSACKSARTQQWTQSSWADVLAALERIRAASGNDRAKMMKAEGFTKLRCALEYIIHCDPTTAMPVDGLHLFPDGLLRSEAAWLFYILFRMGLDIGEENDAIKSYQGWPPDVRIPPLHASLSKGRRGGKPKSSSMLRMTGSQCMHFALHRCARMCTAVLSTYTAAPWTYMAAPWTYISAH